MTVINEKNGVSASMVEHLDQQLVNKVIKWFQVRNLDTGNPFKQYIKLREETEEILESLRLKEGDDEKVVEELKAEFIDGIGDTLVVIIGILTQTHKAWGIEEFHIHPALNNDDVVKRLKDNILNLSDSYTKFRTDLETTFTSNIITHAVDAIRLYTSNYIFSFREGEKLEEQGEYAIKILTSVVSTCLREILSLGSEYFGDENLKNMKLSDCLEVAYNEIKDRRGLTRADGLYYKEENLTPEEIAMLDEASK